MNQYNFILDASAFERGLGNIKRWCEVCKGKAKLNLYIPTFTLNELDFLQQRHKSFNARESLSFIDNLEPRLGKVQNPELDMIIEFPDILDVIQWSDVNINNIETINKLPRRFKNLLKSCVYKCHLDDSDKAQWILVTEDSQVRKIADQCNIPWCSIIEVDSILSKEFKDKSFQEIEKFNDLLLKNGVSQVNEDGENVVKTKFKKTMYASRGKGSLWTP